MTAPVTIWVSTKSTTIVQIDVDDLEYLGDLQLNFFNTVAGPFSPSIYVSYKYDIKVLWIWVLTVFGI